MRQRQKESLVFIVGHEIDVHAARREGCGGPAVGITVAANGMGQIPERRAQIELMRRQRPAEREVAGAFGSLRARRLV